MARLVAKEYANWDRKDKRFPLLRTFDVWEGHSWAGGPARPAATTRNRRSEAVQCGSASTCWADALDDQADDRRRRDGLRMESAPRWNTGSTCSGDVFPAEWSIRSSGMVWTGGQVFGTYFTGDPGWIYGIQWLPASPALDYLVRDPRFAGKAIENMIQDFEAKEKKPGTIKTVRPGPGQRDAGLRADVRSGLGRRESLDALWAEPGDKVAHEAAEMAIMYYMAHAMLGLGRVDWTCHTSSPTSMVYIDPATKRGPTWSGIRRTTPRVRGRIPGQQAHRPPDGPAQALSHFTDLWPPATQPAGDNGGKMGSSAVMP